jgi:hypothetical protein
MRLFSARIALKTVYSAIILTNVFSVKMARIKHLSMGLLCVFKIVTSRFQVVFMEITRLDFVNSAVQIVFNVKT